MESVKPFFDDRIQVRIPSKEARKMDRIIKKLKVNVGSGDVENKYHNRSHFARIAVLKLIREEYKEVFK